VNTILTFQKLLLKVTQSLTVNFVFTADGVKESAQLMQLKLKNHLKVQLKLTKKNVKHVVLV
jgi:hypothetical protein